MVIQRSEEATGAASRGGGGEAAGCRPVQPPMIAILYDHPERFKPRAHPPYAGRDPVGDGQGAHPMPPGRRA
jgi:hypothetical protein